MNNQAGHFFLQITYIANVSPYQDSFSTKAVSRADLHCHSTASEFSKLGVQRSLGLPECATPPEEVYDLAKARGMDFVTITDHDTIEGCLSLTDRSDFFISEELTAWFRGENRAVHVLCLGITPDDHDWLQAHSRDLEKCASYLHEREITCSLAHPFYSVEDPLTPAHRQKLSRLFDIWETRNGSRAPELNHPAAIYAETRGVTASGGSDDHAGVDIGRTWTETPAVSTPEDFLQSIREGKAEAAGEQGSGAKWAHAAIAIAVRSLGGDRPETGPALDPTAVFKIAQRVLVEGNVRRGQDGDDIGPEDARALLDAFLDSIGLDLRGSDLIAYMQSDGFRHEDLERRARAVHERLLGEAVEGAVERISSASGPESLGKVAVMSGVNLFQAAVPVIPYAPAGTFLGREKAKLAPRRQLPRVALIADGISSTHGVTSTIKQIRELGVPGFEVEVLSTDSIADRRVGSVADIEVPLYEGLEIGVPSVLGMVDALNDGRFDLVHLTSPGPANLIAGLIAQLAEKPMVGSWHTELAAYASLRSGESALEATVNKGLGYFYGQCRTVLSPSPASDETLEQLGIEPRLVARWGRGVDTSRFDPNKADPEAYPGEIKVLYAGRISEEKGIRLLADAFLIAAADDPRLHLLIAGGGPDEDSLRAQLGDRATFLGWLHGDELPRAYASSDIFCFPSSTDTFGQVIVEAGASGLPVVAVNRGGPSSLVAHEKTGLLCEPDAGALAGAIRRLADSPDLAIELGCAGVRAASTRTWEKSMEQLADGYRISLPDLYALPVLDSERMPADLRVA